MNCECVTLKEFLEALAQEFQEYKIADFEHELLVDKVYPHKLDLSRHRLTNQVTNRKPRFPIKKII